MGIFNDLSGKKIGKLTVVSFISGTHTKHGKWRCQCDCGKTTYIFPYSLIKNNPTQSCGCLSSRHTVANMSTKHGGARKGKITKEFRAWCHMRERCYVTTCKEYPRWGGRGIKVCDRWLESFENFLEDVGYAPSPKHSADRYPNNDGNYEPLNFRWATRSEQQRNTRDAIIVEYNGIKKPLADWCDQFGVKYHLAYKRIKSFGYTAKEALEEPPKKAGNLKRPQKSNFISYSFGHINA